MRGDLKEMLSAELGGVTIALAAGTGLAFATDQIALVPGLFILIPGFLGMRGSVSGSLAARIGSALHLGEIQKPYTRSPLLYANMGAAVALNLVTSVLLGVASYLLSRMVFATASLDVVWVAVIAGAVATAVLTPLTAASTVALFDRGVDPDNVMGPYVTSTGDVISILSLLLAVWVVA